MRLWSVFFCAVAVLCLGHAGRAVAMSGGEFAQADGSTSLSEWLPWAVLCLPLLLYVHICESLGIVATRRHLSALARARPEFGWKRIDAEVNVAIRSIYAAWDAGDLAPATRQMSPEYAASQRAKLERWRTEGKRNVSQLHRVRSIRPLWVGTRDATHPDTLALLVRVWQVDYLEDTTTGRIVKGSRLPDRTFEAVWLFVLIDDAWRVSGIEGHDHAYGFATLANRLTADDPAASWRVARLSRHG